MIHPTGGTNVHDSRLKHGDAQDLRPIMIHARENVSTNAKARRSQSGQPWSPDATGKDQLDRREEALGLLSKVENLLRK